MATEIDSAKCWQDCEAVWPLRYCLWKHKMVQPFGKIIWQFPVKLNIYNNPAIILLGITRETKTFVYKGQNLDKNIHSSFCPNSPSLETNQTSISRWVDKANSFIHTKEYNLAVKINRPLVIQQCQQILKNTLRERRHNRLHTMWFHFCETLKRGKRNPRDKGKWSGGGVNYKGYERTFSGWKRSVPWLWLWL